MDLDTSWIDIYEKISSIQENYYREPMTKIPVFFIYMNKGDEIIKVICQDEFLEDSRITSERLLQIIEERRHINGSTYKLLDLLQYVVDIEPENLQRFSMEESPNGNQWLKYLPYSLGDIKIPASIFIFHELNHLYFFFRIAPLRSILKSSDSVPSTDFRVTKKVRITEVPIETKKKFKDYLRKSMKRKIGDKTKTKKAVPE